MSVIAEIVVPADQFTLGKLLEVRQGVRIRLESTVPTSDAVVPYFWVESPDVAAVEDVLEEAPIVEDTRIIEQVDGHALFHVDWSVEMNGFIESIRDARAAVLDGRGHGDNWTFRLRFPEYEALSTFYRSMVEKGISVDLQGVHSSIGRSNIAAFGLTTEQEEALTVALGAGYFAIPREVTLEGLADELGISDSAVSQRIRRGLTKLLSATVAQRAPEPTSQPND